MSIDVLNTGERDVILAGITSLTNNFNLGNFFESNQTRDRLLKDHGLSAGDLMSIASGESKINNHELEEVLRLSDVAKIVFSSETSGKISDEEFSGIQNVLNLELQDLEAMLEFVSSKQEFEQIRDRFVVLMRFLKKVQGAPRFADQQKQDFSILVAQVGLPKPGEEANLYGKLRDVGDKMSDPSPTAPDQDKQTPKEDELWDKLIEFIVLTENKLTSSDAYDPRTDNKNLGGKNLDVIGYAEKSLELFKKKEGDMLQVSTVLRLDALIEDLKNRVESLEQQEFQNWVSQITTDAGTPGEPLRTLDKLLQHSGASSTDKNFLNRRIKYREQVLTRAKQKYSSITDDKKISYLNSEYFDKAEKQIVELKEAVELIDWRAEVADLESAISEFNSLLSRTGTYRFQLKDMLRKISDTEATLRQSGRKPLSEDYSVSSRVKQAIKELEERVEEARLLYEGKYKEGQMQETILLRSYREKTLQDLFASWFSGGIVKGGESQRTYEWVLEEKLDELGPRFIDHAISLLPSSHTQADRDMATKEALERYDNFISLVEIASGLIDFGVLDAQSLNTAQLVANHEVILEKAASERAMILNREFNNHPLVRSGGWDDASGSPVGIDLETQSSPGMGLIQKMCYLVFQEMQKLTYSDDEIERAIRKYKANPTGYDHRAERLPPVSERKDGTIGPTSLFDDPNKSFFSRNQGFLAEVVGWLFEAVSKASKLTDIKNNTTALDIANELSLFPPEAQSVIVHIGMQKATRDSLGEDAGAIHVGRNKGAPKQDRWGKELRPANLLASMLYEVGKKGNNAAPTAALSFINLTTRFDLMDKGRPTSLDPKVRSDYKNWGDVANRQVVLATEHVKRYNDWVRPQVRNIKRYIYTPTKWYEDAPRLSEFFNQTESVKLSGDYQRTIGAVLKIIEIAVTSSDISLSSVDANLKQQVGTRVGEINSEVGKALSYIGPYKPGGKYAYVHELIIAAYHEFLMNLLCAVPGGGEIGVVDEVIPWKKMEYRQLLSVAKTEAKNSIEQNSTLSSYWPYLIGRDSGGNRVGNDFFEQDFERKWRNIAREQEDFNEWVIDNTKSGKKPGMFRKAAMLQEIPAQPYYVDPKNIWGKSLEFGD